MEFVSVVISSYDVQQKDVFRFGIQTGNSKLHLRKHLPRPPIKSYISIKDRFTKIGINILLRPKFIQFLGPFLEIKYVFLNSRLVDGLKNSRFEIEMCTSQSRVLSLKSASYPVEAEIKTRSRSCRIERPFCPTERLSKLLSKCVREIANIPNFHNFLITRVFFVSREQKDKF